MHQATVPYSPQQNGLAERMNRTLTKRARSMLYHMQVEKKWWTEAMNTAVYVTNQFTCASWPTKTPFEVCFGNKSDLSHRKVFGSQGYAHVDKTKRLKLDKKEFKCMFLGYSSGVKSYRVWNFGSKRLEITQSVTFQELLKSKYVQVVGDISVTTCMHHDDDDDAAIVQLPVSSTQSEGEPMAMDQESNDHINSPPSEFDVMGLRQDFMHASDPFFDIDDVYMEPTDLDMETNQDIVPRGA